MARWTLDPTHTEVAFSTRHLMVATVNGRFTGVDARIDIDAELDEVAAEAAA